MIMRGKGAKIYRHQFGYGIVSSGGYNSRNYNNNNRDVLYDGDLKPVIKIRKGKARKVGYKKANKWWVKKPDKDGKTGSRNNYGRTGTSSRFSAERENLYGIQKKRTSIYYSTYDDW